MAFVTKSAATVLGAASVLALLAGCTTTGTQDAAYGPRTYAGHNVNSDRLYRDNFVRNTRPETRQVELALAPAAAPNYAQAPYGQAPLNLASFDGIEGARRAHQMFPAQAEDLDGACERYVKIARYENLYDVEQLCDVRVSVLLAYNPSIRDARHIGEGAIIEVPQNYNPERVAFVKRVLAQQPGAGFAGAHAAVAYVVQPGDTLNDIAARHLVSAAAVANVNPGVDWRYLEVGSKVWIPSTVGTGQPIGTPTLGASTPAAGPGAVSGGLPYNYGHAGAGAGSGVVYDVTTVMPYQMTPAQEAAEKQAPRKLLMINKRVVGAGEQVTVTGEGLPADREVSIYRGPNGNEMQFVGTVRTDSNGTFSEDFEVTGDNGGGIIFQAAVEGGTRLQSPRVTSHTN
ncbi:MAG: LysM peptidoglycan-binding domain-containing protein [Parvularculaceae bacterium]|jgi:LysM repeat protein|nr:LysM peptidoglycan-binding domain-containing protein [Parvularculaceae bacterium]